MMNRLARSFFLVLPAAAVLMLVAACSGPGQIAETPPEPVCSSLVNTKCVRCHYKTRICDALGTKSAGNWKKTINFMVKQGAELNADEQSKVIACLSSLPKGSAVVCN